MVKRSLKHYKDLPEVVQKEKHKTTIQSIKERKEKVKILDKVI